MNLLQFSQIPRYKLVRQNAENGWGRSTVYTDLLADDRGEWMRVSDVRDLVVGVHPPPDVVALVEALEWLRGAINATPENDKVQAGTWISTKHPRIKQIDAILAAHRKMGGDT